MILALRQLGYRYPSGTDWAVGPLDLEVRRGERVLLTGPSGCGKSTLLRLAAGLLQRHGDGEVTGTAAVDGRDPAQLRPAERGGAIAFVSQVPGDQLVTGTVGDEIAFALESAGWDAAAIDLRIAEMLALVGLNLPLDRDPRTLSGGQAQRLVVAASLAVGAKVLLLDEPLAQLDPAGGAALLGALDGLAAQGVAVILVEHRLEACLPWADRVVLLDRGALVADRPAADVDGALLAGRGLQVPGVLALRAALDAAGRTLDDLQPPPVDEKPIRKIAAQARDLRHHYGDHLALDGVTLAIHAGERVALIGANGAGKSTLLAAFSDELPGVEVNGRTVDVPQDPDLALFCGTVRAELAYGPSEWRLPDRTAAVAEALGIAPLLERPPQALSRGQRLRVAVGAALTCEPALLLLDEPTSGQDHRSVERLMDALSGLPDDTAVLFATHDVDLALRRADRIALLDGGRLVRVCTPAALLEAPGDVGLPPLAAICRAHGLPYLAPADLAAL